MRRSVLLLDHGDALGDTLECNRRQDVPHRKAEHERRDTVIDLDDGVAIAVSLRAHPRRQAGAGESSGNCWVIQPQPQA